MKIEKKKMIISILFLALVFKMVKSNDDYQISLFPSLLEVSAITYYKLTITFVPVINFYNCYSIKKSTNLDFESILSSSFQYKYRL